MIVIKDINIVIIANQTLNTNKLRRIIEQSGIKICSIETDIQQLSLVIERHEPDLILLDVTYINNDKTIIDEIIITFNLPLIMLSSRSIHDTAKTVFAITNGASDFILYDQLNMPYYEKEVVKKIKNVFTAVPIKKKLTRLSDTQVTEKEQHSRRQKQEKIKQTKMKPSQFNYIVAIGTSTGGPKALQTVLSNIPKNFPAPIVIVQHMPSGFTKSLAERLDNICHINVREAVDGDALEPGTAYIAPGNYHMIVNESFEISVYKDHERDGHRPSVNILFESIASLSQISKIAVVLTGMGKDGATGVTAMKKQDKNTVIIVESEETAIIHGMPRAALKTGYVTEVIRLENIGESIIHYIMKRGN